MNFFKRKQLIAIILAVALYAQPVLAAETFDVDFAPGTPIVDALRGIGYRAGKNIVINGELNGTVALSLSSTDFDKALNVLAMTHGFNYEEKDGVVLISPSKTMSSMKTIHLDHLDLDFAKKQMELIFDEDKVMVNPDTNTITVDGSTAQILKAETELKKLDIAQPQVNIKATVIELSKNKARDLGLSFSSNSWSKDTAVSGYEGVKFAITAVHEETYSKGNILARPDVTVFNGRNAHIMMGDKVPVFTSTSTSNDSSSDSTVSVEYKDVGIQLDVLPRINDKDKETITMQVKPTISAISEWSESGNNRAPVIATREAETILRVRSGETILLGGLLKEEEIDNIKQIPFLSKLPILGELFKSRSKSKKNTEIVIAITPTIIPDVDGVPQVELQKISPKLHRELNEKQSAPVESNLSKELQDNLDSVNAELKKKLEEKEAENAKLKEENQKTKEESKKAKEELSKSTEIMKKFIEKAKKNR